MRICLYSNVFFPSIGGMESVAMSLARTWTMLGHDVLVISDTPGDAAADAGLPFRIVRLPGAGQWLALLADRQVLICNGHSLRHVKAWRAAGIPFGWIHGMFLGGRLRDGVKSFLRLRFRRTTMRLANFNVCVSRTMKEHIRVADAVIIPNPVSSLFRRIAGIARTERFVFYGRMWMPKGMDTLLEAMALCREKGVAIAVDFYGDGPDLPAARALAGRLGLQELAAFHGMITGEPLVRAINAGRAVVVPSRCNEAFGLAAAESFACGKCVIGSLDGGLAEVLGDAALTFPPGDRVALARQMLQARDSEETVAAFEKRAAERAPMYAEEAVARRYIELFEKFAR